jgi:hypothetical protein
MPAIEVQCPACLTMHRIRQTRAGQRGRCPCGNIFQVPDPPPPPPPDVIDLGVNTWQPLTRANLSKNRWVGVVGASVAVAMLIFLAAMIGDFTKNGYDTSVATEGARAVFGGLILAVILAVALAFYLLPTIIAVLRKHQHMPAIVAVNILLGWSFLGWVAALVWALTESRSRDHHHYHYNNP